MKEFRWSGIRWRMQIEEFMKRTKKNDEFRKRYFKDRKRRNRYKSEENERMRDGR